MESHFIEDIQNSFVDLKESFINFTDGYLYQLQALKIVRCKADDGTNTIRFIEKCTPGTHAKTVYYFDHHRNAAEFAPVKNLSQRPSWIICIHEENLMNNMDVHPVVSAALNWDDYDWASEFGTSLPISLTD